MSVEAKRARIPGRVQGVLAVVVVVVIGIGAVLLYRDDAKTPSLDQSRVRTTAVLPSVPERVSATAQAQSRLEPSEIRGQLVPRRYTTLASEIGAKVDRIGVPEGGRFRAGEALVRLDCSLQWAQRDRARAELVAANRTLSANGTLAELDAVGKLDLALSVSAVDRASAELRASEALVSKCTIEAPFAGHVAVQKVREKQFVQPGQELLEIIDVGSLQLEFIAPSSWQPKLVRGTRFEVRIDETGKAYEARLLRVGARVDPVSQSIKVTAAIDGQHPELIAGMSGVVSARF